MPDAQFIPSNAGSQLVEQQFGIANGFQNLFARAEALKQSHEQFEMQKQRFATEQTMAALDMTSRANQITAQNNALELDALSKKNQTLQIDADFKAKTNEIANATAMSNLLTAARADVDRFNAIPHDDPDELNSQLAALNAKYGAAMHDPKYAAQFGEILGPVIANATSRTALATSASERVAGKALLNLNAILATDEDGSQLKAFLLDPNLSKIANPALPNGKALFDAVSEGVKALQKRRADVAAKQAEFAGKKAEQDAKDQTSRSVPGFTGIARSPEQAGKLAESVASFKSSSDSIDQLIGITKDASAFDKLAPTEVAAKATALASLITAENKTKIVGPGAVSESEWDILHKLVADPSKMKNVVFRNQALASLGTLKDVLGKKMKNEIDLSGLQPAPGNPFYQGPKTTAPQVGSSFSATIGGKEVKGTWHEENGRQGLLTADGLFYPANP